MMIARKLAGFVGWTVLFTAMAGCGAPSLPQPVHEEVMCRSPLGHRTARRVFRWKFDVLQKSIRDTLEREESLTTEELLIRIKRGFAPEMLESLGDLREVFVLVLLELETRGEVQRIPVDDQSEIGSAYRRSEGGGSS